MSSIEYIAPGMLTDRRRSIWREGMASATSQLGGAADTGLVLNPETLTLYQRSPIRWMVERLGIPERTLRWSMNPGYERHVWDGTPDPLVVICDSLAAWQNVGVESATGTQKTFTAAAIMYWFLDCFEDSIVTTMAPREKQLELHLWKEARRLWPRFKRLRPDAFWKYLSVQMEKGSEVWAAQGVGVGVRAEEESATKAQGSHAEHQLFIIEETPGMDPAVLTAVDMTCSAPHNLQLRLGNPDHQLDPLHRYCERPSVVAVRMSSLDHPNVVCRDASIVPGACSYEQNELRRQDYGETSPLYQSRTRGISPAQATEALIRREWLQAAVDKTPEEKKAARRMGPRGLGHDVANSDNGDEAAIAHGEGALLLVVTAEHCPDAREYYAIHVHPLIGPKLAAENVAVDAVGVGASPANEARRLGDNIQAIFSGGSAIFDPEHEEEFVDLRSQMHWTFRRELFHGEIAFQDVDEETWRDLMTPKWGTRHGKIFVESKEDLKKHLPGHRSPDRGDAVILWNWARKPRAYVLPQPPRRYGVGSATYTSV